MHGPDPRCRSPSAVLLAFTMSTVAALISVRGGAQETRDRVAARVEHYVDRNATGVTRARGSFDLGVTEGHRLTGSYTTDVITSASIDVITRASEGIEETRHDATVGYSRVRETRNYGLSYAYGHEPDFRSYGVRLAHGRDLDARRQTRLDLSVGYNRGRIGVVNDAKFVRHLDTFSATASLTRVLNRRVIGRLGLELMHLHGFQSSAYRTVRLGDWSARPGDPNDPEESAYVFEGVTGVVRERHPGERFRAKLTADTVVAVGDDVGLAVSLGAYGDSFGVFSGEARGELRVEPRSGLLLRLGTRVYVQSAAWFHRARYRAADQTEGYVTDDKELGRLRGYAAHAAVTVPAGPVRFEARIEWTRHRYPLFNLLPRNDAAVASLAVSYVR